MEAIIAIAALALCIILRFWLGVVIVLVILFATSAPAYAHTDMDKEQRQQIHVLTNEVIVLRVAVCTMAAKLYYGQHDTDQAAEDCILDDDKALKKLMKQLKETKQ